MGISAENSNSKSEVLDKSVYLQKTPWLQFMIVSLIFGLWAMAINLNDILIAQFKKGFDLSDTQTAFVQSVFFLGYFFVALPAAAVIKKYSYKTSIVVGLMLYAIGCFMFIPATSMMTYGAFLGCLAIIASGLAFLETSCNTYSSLLGPIETSTQRINFSQIFNAFGAIFGVYIGQLLVFNKDDASHEELAKMPVDVANVIRHQMVDQVVNPYLVIGSMLILISIVVICIKFPSCKPKIVETQKNDNILNSLGRLFSNYRFSFGVFAQFLYVGAQIGVWSFTIRFVQLVEKGTTEHGAAYWLIISLFCYAAGKLVSTYLMRKVNPAKLLGIFAALAVILLAIAVFTNGLIAISMLCIVSFCMAPCWPTIFGLVIKGMGKDTHNAGSIVVMSIIGGAVVPLIMGMISDANGGNMQIAFLVPLICFVYIAFYGFYCERKGV